MAGTMHKTRRAAPLSSAADPASLVQFTPAACALAAQAGLTHRIRDDRFLCHEFHELIRMVMNGDVPGSRPALAC